MDIYETDLEKSWRIQKEQEQVQKKHEQAEKSRRYQRNYQRQVRALMTHEERKEVRAISRQRYANLSAEDREKRLQKKREYQKTYRLHLSPRQRIRLAIATNINQRLRRFHIQKKNSSLWYLSCDMEWLEAWLEVQFKPGMTWENWGKKGWAGWQIDHIKPCRVFDLTDPLQQKRCFHWTNLQPLWSAENLSKNGTY